MVFVLKTSPRFKAVTGVSKGPPNKLAGLLFRKLLLITRIRSAAIATAWHPPPKEPGPPPFKVFHPRT